MPETEASILENIQAFAAFARRRVGEPRLARELVRNDLLKALSDTKAKRGEGRPD